jgi:hypothetical protein
MHKIAQKRGFNFFCYIPSGYVAPPPPPDDPPEPEPPVFNENEQQLVDDLTAALAAFQPQKTQSDLILQGIQQMVETQNMTYQQEHQYRQTVTSWMLSALLETHVATMTALISEEIALDVRSNILKYMLNQIYTVEDSLVYNVEHELYGLRTDIGDLWQRFVAEHQALKALIDSLAATDRPTGDDTYDPGENQTDTSTVRAGLQAIIDDYFLYRMTVLVDAAHAKIQELEAMFLIENLPEVSQIAYRREKQNLDYSSLGRYIGSEYGIYTNDAPAVYPFFNTYSPFNLAERNALKVLYNEEDILITIFNNGDLVPPSATGVLFEEEHGRLKGIIDGV